MARNKFSSPTLVLRISDEDYERAQKSKSGSCLVADGLKSVNPNLSSIAVDMATIRASDKKSGKRYIYLTPPSAQHLLLSFDQGWPRPVDEIVVKRAVKVVPITATKKESKSRMERKAELEAKVAAGEELTRGEKSALTRIKKSPERPATPGKAEVNISDSGRPVVSGGKPPPMGKAHPNLLRGTDRHFGAKLSNPGDVFNEAVEAAVNERLASMEDLSWK